jgi:TolB-like protein
MKRCPECRRDYYDDTLAFCLEDGTALLQGSVPSPEEPQTAILSEPGAIATGFRGDEGHTTPFINITDQTAILRTGAEAEPRASLDRLPKSQSHSANKAAKPLIAAVVVLAAVVAVFFGYRYLSSTDSNQIESIAVMPFVNESGNADVEYLSDGMTETLITSLSQLANLNVKGRSSVFRYKGKDLDTKTLGKELGVQAVLYGRVVQRGDQLTLSLELLDALTDNVIWSGRYDRKQSDVVSLQSEIARDVSNKLRTKLTGVDAAKVEKEYTANPEAYRLYLQGRFYWNKRNETAIKKSIEYFDQAITLDPSYALAYAGLADAWQVLPSYTDDPPSEIAFPNARTAAQRALELDPALAEPHAALGVVLHEYDWKFAEAETEFRRAIALDPNYASAHQWYSEYLMNMGRFDESIAEAKRAYDLDPLSLIINVSFGRVYFVAGRNSEAIVQYRRALEIDPDFKGANRSLVQVYETNGMYLEAIDQMAVLRRLEGWPLERIISRTEALRDAFKRSGAPGYWQKRVEFANEFQGSQSSETIFFLAQLYTTVGNKMQALDILENSLKSGKHNKTLVRIKTNPVLAPLRSEPRFKDLVRRIGLPE